jgi:hypothetical protein
MDLQAPEEENEKAFERKDNSYSGFGDLKTMAVKALTTHDGQTERSGLSPQGSPTPPRDLGR